MNAASAPLIHPPDARVLPAVWKLVMMRFRINWNGFRHAKTGRKIRMIIVWLLILSFAAFIFWLSWLLLGFLHSPDFARYAGVNLESWLDSMPALALSAMFLTMLLTNFGVLLQALYLSGDMDFLLTTPVPIRAVFVSKFLQAVLPNLALIALFGLPLLFGLGVSAAYRAAYYPFVVLLMAALALAAAAISSLLVMLVVRVLPPRRAAEILGFLGALIGFSCSQIGNLVNVFGKDIHISNGRLNMLLWLSRVQWLPLNWAGRGLSDLGSGRWLSGLSLTGASLVFAGFVFWFALVTAERWYYTGWAGMQVVARGRKARTVRPARARASGPDLTGWLPAPVLALVRKDFRTLTRDLRGLSQLISPIVIGLVYSVMLLRGGNEGLPSGSAPALVTESVRLLLAFGSVGLSLFVGWMFLTRLAGMSFSHEGRSYWILKTAPLGPSQLLTAKFLVAYLPTLGLALVLLIVISVLRTFAWTEFLYSLVAIAFCLAGMTGIQLSFGVAGANFKWEDPRRMNAGWMGCLGQIVTIVYLPVSFGLFILPLGVVSLFGQPAALGYGAGLVAGGAVAIACAFLPPWLVRRRVAELGEG